ncbi:glycosyltransferase family 2 protein [Halorarius litoreus]|uniref:glycosyltransferase family 2 protein n=1 Tax=Halorarius litoreus TaxID=2962676 RepID=UPI0020CCE70A|nr:glycosyltransferase family 2 protein [Halorarius litoreus]
MSENSIPTNTGNLGLRATATNGHEQPTDHEQQSHSGDELLLQQGSNRTPTISVIMPTLNEEDGIEECIVKIKTALEELQVYGEIIVSDDSTDRTPEIAREQGCVVINPDRDGYGYAYRYAFDHVRGDYIVIGDADTTYDFEEIPRLLRELEETGADMVMGSRLEGEIEPGAMPPLHQYIGNPLLTWFLNAFYGADVSDAHSGFRIFNREVLEDLDFQTTGMEFASEMIMEAGAKNLDIAEVPITYHERKGEATLESFQDGWRHVKFMLQNAPSYLFTGPAIGMGIIGVCLMFISMLQQPVEGVFLGTHTAIAGSLFIIVGYQVGSLSIFSSIATNPIQKPKDPVTSWVNRNFQLQHGATLGLGFFAFGALGLAYCTWVWVGSGFSISPNVVITIISVTAVILGVQTVFYAFFLSMIAENRT